MSKLARKNVKLLRNSVNHIISWTTTLFYETDVKDEVTVARYFLHFDFFVLFITF